MTTMTHTASGTGHDGSISDDQLASFRAGFAAQPTARIAQNAVTRTDINDVSLNRSVVTDTDFTFSTLLDDWEVTNQRQSGRCWMFAALNLMRVGAMKSMNLGKFEFSQNYLFFWCELLPRADHRHRGPGHRRPHRRLHARRADR